MPEETTTEATTEAAPTEAAPTESQTVPYERFASKIAEIKDLEEKLSIAAQAIDTATALQERLTEATAAHTQETSAWGQTEALLRAGVLDSEVAELARWRFEKSGAEDFTEWLGTDAKTDPLLSAHLAPPAQPAAQATPTPPTPPNPNAGARSAPPPRGEFSPEAVQGMSVDEVKKNYARIAGAWGYKAHAFK